MNRETPRAEGVGIGHRSAEEVRKLSAQLLDIKEQLDRIASHPMVGPRPSDVPGNPGARLERALTVQSMLEVRDRCFGDMGSMFGDPAFDILLLLYTSTLRGRSISVSAAASAGQVKSTTGLRWLHNLTDLGLIERQGDTRDARRSYVLLTPSGMTLMDRYIDALRL